MRAVEIFVNGEYEILSNENKSLPPLDNWNHTFRTGFDYTYNNRKYENPQSGYDRLLDSILYNQKANLLLDRDDLHGNIIVFGRNGHELHDEDIIEIIEGISDLVYLVRCNGDNTLTITNRCEYNYDNYDISDTPLFGDVYVMSNPDSTDDLNPDMLLYFNKQYNGNVLLVHLDGDGNICDLYPDEINHISMMFS